MLRIAAAVAVFAWGANGSKIGSRVETSAPAAPPPARGDGTLRVVQFNMLHEFPFFIQLAPRIEIIAEALRKLDADIICLQEVPWTLRLGNVAELLAQRLNMHHAFFRVNANRYTIGFEDGEGILSRYPLRDAAGVELFPAPGPFRHRIALYATAATPTGDVGVFVTHLEGRRGINEGQCASLKTFVKATGVKPAFIAGDFNAKEDSEGIKLLTQDWIDVYRHANPQAKGATCCVDDLNAPPDTRISKRIDYLFLAPSALKPLSIRSAEVVLNHPAEIPGGYLWPSDHLGVLAVCETPR